MSVCLPVFANVETVLATVDVNADGNTYAGDDDDAVIAAGSWAGC